MDETLLKPTQVAERLQISKPHAYRLLQRGDEVGLQVVRIGRSVRVDPVVLRKWLDNGGTKIMVGKNGKVSDGR